MTYNISTSATRASRTSIVVGLAYLTIAGCILAQFAPVIVRALGGK